jgi:hypothetical protein
MVEGNPRSRSKRDPERETGAGDFVFRDDPASKSPQSTSQSTDTPGLAAGDVFDLVDEPGTDDSTPANPTSPIAAAGQTAQAARPAKAAPKPVRDQSRLDPSVLVSQVWSRLAEWGPSLIVVGTWAFLALGFVYYSLLQGELGQAFLGLLVGGLVATVLSYPMLITLERPVRFTPEQAVRDYYTAVSHHLPHLRRMWLLLSAAGRVSSSFGSYEGFKAYWKTRLRELRKGHALPTTPLVFEVADFQCEKSAGMIQVDTEFKVKVFVRGRRKAGPIHTFPKRIAMVRGPGQMWYLEDGTLTPTPREPKSTGS